MTTKGKKLNHEPYAYSYTARQPRYGPSQFFEFDTEPLPSISDYLKVLTGGCEVCRHSDGDWCTRQGRSVKAGDPRCADFVRGLGDEAGRDIPAKMIHGYINEMLGITDAEKVRRLMGK